LSFTAIRNTLTIFWVGAGLGGIGGRSVGASGRTVGEGGRIVGEGGSAGSAWAGVVVGRAAGPDILVGECSIPTSIELVQAVTNIPMRNAKTIRGFMESS
jgi:hypothetical protein